MPRTRIAVALIPPDGLADAVQALRRAVADPRIDELPPHLTLIPPINLTADDLLAVRQLLRRRAASFESFDLSLGPATSFAPATPTLHLEVGGELDELMRFRASLREAPIDRPDNWPFVPHVTLCDDLDDPARSGAISSLTGHLALWRVDRVHLLEQHVDANGRFWTPVVEELLGPPVVVGRGGIEVVLRTVELVEPEVARLFGPPGTVSDEAVDAVPPRWSRGDGRMVVAAETPGRCGTPIGAAVGRATGDGAQIAAVEVAEEHRGLGIGRHLVERWTLEAARRGCRVVVADAGPTDALLTSVGFARTGSLLVRQLQGGRPE